MSVVSFSTVQGQVVAAYVTRPRQIPVTLGIHQFGCIEDHLDVAGGAEALT